MRISFYLAYIYYRKLFPKGDVLTIASLIAVAGYALYGLYHHYDSLHYLLWGLPLGTLAYHYQRKDLTLLKVQPQYPLAIIGEYLVENLLPLLLMFWKADFITAIGVIILLVIIAFLPQKNWVLRYPFSLSDPFWHISFRQYKLIIMLPIAIALIIIGAMYANPNIALFALAITALTGCMPYFEREYKAHMVVATHKGKDYLLQQLKAGIYNSTLLFAPVLITYFICFKWQYIEVYKRQIYRGTASVYCHSCYRSTYQIYLLETTLRTRICPAGNYYRDNLHHTYNGNPLFLLFSNTKY